MQTLEGPLSAEAIEIFTRHLNWCVGTHTMVLDPESAGHQMYQHGGRYQWKVKGGRSADHQGVSLIVSGDGSIYFIRRNRVKVVIQYHDLGIPWDEAIRKCVDDVLPPTFKFVLVEMMDPYER